MGLCLASNVFVSSPLRRVCTISVNMSEVDAKADEVVNGEKGTKRPAEAADDQTAKKHKPEENGEEQLEEEELVDEQFDEEEDLVEGEGEELLEEEEEEGEGEEGEEGGEEEEEEDGEE